MKKKSAAERTIDMFATKTETGSADLTPQEDAVDDAKRASPVIEENVDRYREKAFQVQEWTTESFSAAAAACHQTDDYTAHQEGAPVRSGPSFRLTKKNGIIYLEQLRRLPGQQMAYHYAGVMFQESDLIPLAQLFAQAARAQKQGQ